MAEKAVLVTNANVEELTMRFQHDGTGVVPAVGYFLVTHFGDDQDYDMVSPANFQLKYTKGQELLNGFFEAIPKGIPNG